MGNNQSDEGYQTVTTNEAASSSSSSNPVAIYDKEPNFQELFDKHKNDDLRNVAKTLIHQYGSIDAVMHMHTIDSGFSMLLWTIGSYTDDKDDKDNFKRMELIEILLENGANPNKLVSYNTIGKSESLSTLLAMCYIEDVKIQIQILILLIKYGLDVNTKCPNLDKTMASIYFTKKNIGIFYNKTTANLYNEIINIIFTKLITPNSAAFKECDITTIKQIVYCADFEQICNMVIQSLGNINYPSYLEVLIECLGEFYNENKSHTVIQKANIVYNILSRKDINISLVLSLEPGKPRPDKKLEFIRKIEAVKTKINR